MEIKTKHKKFNSFTDLYSFMIDSHLEEISVTMKYPDGTKSLELCQLTWFYHSLQLNKLKL